MAAKAGHGSWTWSQCVCEIQSGFLQGEFPEKHQVVCYLPKRTPGAEADAGMLIPYLVVRSLYGLRQAPCFWAKTLGETLGEIGSARPWSILQGYSFR
eukprot:426392-Amphidinium_carterae.2